MIPERRRVEPEETAIAIRRLDKLVFIAADRHTKIEELLKAVFPV
jgi:hypothetical protein